MKTTLMICVVALICGTSSLTIAGVSPEVTSCKHRERGENRIMYVYADGTLAIQGGSSTRYVDGKATLCKDNHGSNEGYHGEVLITDIPTGAVTKKTITAERPIGSALAPQFTMIIKAFPNNSHATIETIHYDCTNESK